MADRPKNKLAPPLSGQEFILTKRTVFYGLILLGLIWIAFLYRSVISSLILGALLAYLLVPAADFLSRKFSLSYKVSAWLVFSIFLVLLISLTRYSAPIVVRQVKILTRDFEVISDEIISLQPVLEDVFNISLPLDEFVAELEHEISQVLVPNRLFLILQSATDNFVWIMVTIMTCFYLLLDHDKFISWIISITPSSLRGGFRTMLAEIDLVWKNFLRGQLLLMLIIGLFSGIAGVAVGLRNALLIAVLAGFLELVPSLGPTISTVIAGVAAWTQGSQYFQISNFWFTVLVCTIFILIQLVENTILVPRIMGRRMKLHPALVFIAIITTLTLFGVIASLIVVPLIASLSVIINHSFQQLETRDDQGV